MLTDAEITKLRELIARPRPQDKPYYWCHAVDGPLAGEKVALSMRLADCLRRHPKTATIHFGLATGTGWIAAVYRPAGARKLGFVDWYAPSRRGGQMPYLG